MGKHIHFLKKYSQFSIQGLKLTVHYLKIIRDNWQTQNVENY